MKRVFLIVLDSFGIGEAPDAEKFGDKGANTLKSVYNTGKLSIPTLTSMGLGNIFRGSVGCFERTADRRDFSLEPPGVTMLDILSEAGKDVIGVGKIGDIFAMRGISESYPTHSNKEGMDKLFELISRDFNGLCFVNLVDFDMNYGHRQDADGYALALNEFDSRLAEIAKGLTEDDVLMICADHGCDPSDTSTDHTREYIPLLIYNKAQTPENLGTVEGFSFIGQRVLEYFGIYTDF